MGYYAEDEDELQEPDFAPYSDITDRPPLEDISLGGIAAKGNPVRDMISQRVGMGKKSELSNDPLYQQYEKDQGELEGYRKAQMGSNQIANMGQAFSQIARGASNPEPNDALYKNMENQQGQLLKSHEEDLDRRQKIINAIENRREQALRREELGQHRKDVNSRMDARMRRLGMNNTEIKQLPGEDQEVVKDLAKKNASKIAIANQIDSVMSNWDNLPEDQKVAQGRQLLKVLNSTEGADAVGNEEARRLGSKLEFALGNIFNSNPTQWGRDLKGFNEQALGTSKAIRGAVDANESEINKRYAKVGINKSPVEGNAFPHKAGDPSLIPSAHAAEIEGPHGTSVIQNGVTFIWNGKDYVPAGGP
jgi:hypothetical protein